MSSGRSIYEHDDFDNATVDTTTRTKKQSWSKIIRKSVALNKIKEQLLSGRSIDEESTAVMMGSTTSLNKKLSMPNFSSLPGSPVNKPRRASQTPPQEFWW